MTLHNKIKIKIYVLYYSFKLQSYITVFYYSFVIHIHMRAGIHTHTCARNFSKLSIRLLLISFKINIILLLCKREKITI